MGTPVSARVRWRNFQRGAGWLLVAAIGLWSIDQLAWTGLSEYSVRKLGALYTVAACVWGGYRVSRDVLRIDPSSLAHTPVAAALLHLARALLIGLFALAACASV